MTIARGPIKGRGAVSNRDSRYNATSRVPLEEPDYDEPGTSPATVVMEEAARSIISRNNSPDLPFDRSINPYRGCEHGCVYCYARPTHAYLGLSPGLDFETRLIVKRDAGLLLRRELRRKGYICKPIALGANTDPYQPIERHYRSTREILQILHDCHHPVTLTTKSALIERDLDLLLPMAHHRLVEVQLSVTTLDSTLARILEPRAASPARRLQTLARLSEHGIPTRVLVAPVIPFINDAEIDAILAESARCGARSAGYVLLRLPLEVAELFQEWLREHFPSRAQRVMNWLQEMYGGKVYDSRFGVRQSGTGVFAELLRRRFTLAQRKHGLHRPMPQLDTTLFSPPRADSIN